MKSQAPKLNLKPPHIEQRKRTYYTIKTYKTEKTVPN